MFGTAVELKRQQNTHATGRAMCPRCRRPSSACYCAHVTPIETRTRLVLLQHPRERYVAIGTAHMASLCLTNSELHIGIDWSQSASLARTLADPDRKPILLYPGEGSIDIVREPPPGPVTLVVVDGTWSQTKKVVRTNPILAALPRYAFVPPKPSEYRIRKEPDAASVATIEALVHALTALEGDASRFEALLAPFRAMIDFQIECEERHRNLGSRHAKRKARVRRMRVPRVLSDRLEDVVCVAGEANAWPYAVRMSNPIYEDELVHWAAFRPATGETFGFIVAPRRELAPGTTSHTEIDEAALRSGGTVEELHARWRAFVRDTDVICSWGRYETNLFERCGGHLPRGRLDLRHVARDIAPGRVGTLSEYRDQVSPHDDRGLVVGRAGRKLRAIADIIEAFTTIARAAAEAR